MWHPPSSRRRGIFLAASFFLVSCFSLLSYEHRDTIREHGAKWLKEYRYKQWKAQWRPPDRGIIDEVPLRWHSDSDRRINEIRADAHKLAAADHFHKHFAEVTALKGMTYEEARAGCTWREDEYVNLMWAPDEDWVLKRTSEESISGRRLQWQNWVRTQLIPWEDHKSRFSGRGIVIVGGNHNTLERIKVSIRSLVKIGSTIPIEIHYWADEINEAKQTLLKDMYPPGMFFNDLSKPHNLFQVRRAVAKMPSYGFKPAALLNTRFAEPLLLDADNIPVIKPELLYESDTYKEYGSVFWPDISRTRPENPIWAITNTACKMDEYEQESGQLLVDKTRYWYHLQLASWMNNEQGAFYNTYLLGDKDTFRFAWHALKTKYGRPAKWLASAGTVNFAGDEGTYCGYDFAQHHPDPRQSQVAFMHGGLLKSVHPELLLWNKEQGGIFRHYKRSPTDEDPSVSIHVKLKWDSAEYFHNRSEVFVGPSCTDMEDVEPRDINELIPGWEQFFEDIGGYWLLDRPDLKPPY